MITIIKTLWFVRAQKNIYLPITKKKHYLIMMGNKETTYDFMYISYDITI